MEKNVESKDNELQFQEMMRVRLDKGEDDEKAENAVMSYNEERLREMNKRLPDWDLEPPFSFLK